MQMQCDDDDDQAKRFVTRQNYFFVRAEDAFVVAHRGVPTDERASLIRLEGHSIRDPHARAFVMSTGGGDDRSGAPKSGREAATGKGTCRVPPSLKKKNLFLLFF